MRLLKKLLLGVVCCCLCGSATGQGAGRMFELNAKVTVNSDKVQSTNKQVFTTLQTALTEFLNNRKWTDAIFALLLILCLNFGWNTGYS